MKSIKLVMVIFIAIAVVSLILLLDLFAIKGLLPFSQAIENSLFSGQLGLLFLITGAVIWKHADASSDSMDGIWLTLEPLLAILMWGVGLFIIGTGIFVLLPSKASELILGYYTPTLMSAAIILISVIFLFYYLHIKAPKT
ncbi:MAG: hypothetical protein HY973_00560 [Candidatus Kerfeldbacteria bacterium]|nr:hypothetical protein [Candidatus Kerfeldbacteria bacterium]